MFEDGVGMCGGEVGIHDHEDALEMCEEVLGMNAREVALGIYYVLEGICLFLTLCTSEWFH